MNLLDAIARLFEYITSWLPRPFLINVTQRGVRFRMGKPPILLEPGFHIKVPLVSTVEEFSLLKDATEFEPIVLPTKDGKPVAIGFVIIWHIDPENVIKAATTTDSLTAMVGEIGESLLPPLVMQYDWETLLARIRGGGNLKTIDEFLTADAQAMLEEYGVTVDRARINFLSPARVLKLISNPLA